MNTSAPDDSLIGTIKKSAPVLSVGLLSADLMQLGDAVATLENCGAQMLHFDVADGCFCPLFTAGAFFVKGTRTRLFKDVHLMVQDPLPVIPEFAAAGADAITVQVESGGNIHRALQLIGEQKNVRDPDRGILRGIALLPGTPLSMAEPLLPEADLVFLIAVNPGFPKQHFIEATADRFRTLRAMAGTGPYAPLLAIDGGITSGTIEAAASLNPALLVSGSAVFENGRIAENFERLTDLAGRNR